MTPLKQFRLPPTPTGKSLRISPNKTRKLKIIPKPKTPEKEKEKAKTEKVTISPLAKCIRNRSATAKLKKEQFIDHHLFNPKDLDNVISEKFTTVIENIKKLDAEDKKKHGHLFKHFIFTDLKDAESGAKAFAGFLIANGFNLVMKNRVKMIKRGGVLVPTKNGELYLDIDKKDSNNFAMLQSQLVWNSILTVQLKQDILTTFNKRPDNIHGEDIRIIVLDSKFKEGIDLYDVKYVHLLEPAIGTSDLKQAVGRATRFCGQSGLNFLPRSGWPLHVFVYHTEIPKRPPFVEEDDNNEYIDTHDLMMQHSGLDLALINLTRDITTLAIQSAVDYDINYKINNFRIENEILDETNIAVAEVAPNANVVAIHHISEMSAEMIAKCAEGPNKVFPFDFDRMRERAEAIGLTLKNDTTREELCRILSTDPEYFMALMKPMNIKSGGGAANFNISDNGSKIKNIKPFNTVAPAYNISVKEFIKGEGIKSHSKISRNTELEPLRFEEPETVKSVMKTPPVKTLQMKLKEISHLPFIEYQKAIAELYAAYNWDAPIIKDGCKEKRQAMYGKPVTFTQTQDFIRHYLTPTSPFKGLLAWHSVGTGKTCMAVAAATSYFEKAGYNIIWVTRNSLMSDIYKNIFGAVCSIPIIEQIEAGKQVPRESRDALKMLSKQWFKPVSYRTFLNAMKEYNEMGKMLYALNKEDPLRKTFVIIDEIHKLNDGDLSPGEMANFSEIRDYIYNSYKVSGADSVRLLLMTATPITKRPDELFDIINLLIPDESQRLITMTDFRSKFTTERGEITEEGREYFKNHAKGLISYLNREYDPTTFAQPIFTRVSVPLSDISAEDTNNLIYKCIDDAGLWYNEPNDNVTLLKMINEEYQNICGDYATFVDNITDTTIQSDLYDIIDTITTSVKDDHIKNIQTIHSNNNHFRIYENNVIKQMGECYNNIKDAVIYTKGRSQLSGLEKCFEEKESKAFMGKREFNDIVKKILEYEYYYV